MHSQAIVDALHGRVPDGAVDVAPAADGMPAIYVAREHVVAVCTALRDRPELGFAFCADMTAADYLPREPRFEVVMHAAALGVPGFGATAQRLRIKVRVPGGDPSMPTVSGVWPGMAWAEREVWDMFGIRFDGHPDLRRILMPEDWDGHPARKDYPVQIKMKPKVYEALQLTPEQFAANIRAERSGK
ncbi:MAG: NADH-quinone oxidoreductase subunit C [Vicinamibacterales bacterium]